MPISFNCECGKTLRVADQNAGKRVKCPACSAVVTAPQPEFEAVEHAPEPLVAPPPEKPGARPVAKPVAPRAEGDEDDARGYGASKSGRDDEEQPERKKQRPKWKDRAEARTSGGGSSSGSIAGGILMMVVAAVWFALGLMNDRIFIYPPILFVVGTIAFIKGLAGRE